MPHITIVSVGKLKEDYWKSAEQEYLKRLKPYAKIEIKELKEEAFTEKDNPETIKQQEAEKIKKAIPKDSFIIVLDIQGKKFSSEQLSANLFNSVAIQQFNNVSFIIGGPLGLHTSIISQSNERISLSTLTFTHQMARVILLEQLYRGFMIKEKRKYHY